jgi:hypothetical protein
MEQDEIDKYCDDLHQIVDLGPGTNAIALNQALAILLTLQFATQPVCCVRVGRCVCSLQHTRRTRVVRSIPTRILLAGWSPGLRGGSARPWDPEVYPQVYPQTTFGS